jgi:hypothetical protein
MDAAQIRAGLALIAERYLALALVFHVLLAVAAVAVWRGWRPSNRSVAGMMIFPAVSVAMFAARTHNPFNAIAFVALGVTMAVLARGVGDGAVMRGPAWATAVGAVMIAFGWSYPHFLANEPAYVYLFAAPTGLLPCPTLSLLVGVSLLLGGLGSRAWARALAAAGLFYGLFGVFRLGVLIDLVLVLGSAALIVGRIVSRRSRRVGVDPAEQPVPFVVGGLGAVAGGELVGPRGIGRTAAHGANGL